MAAEVYTVNVLASRLHEAQEALEKLAKKARRYGCPDITVSVGETSKVERIVKDWDGGERRVKVQMVELNITGAAPRIGQHEFLARVELRDGGNLVDTRPGVEDLEPRFRTTDGYCDHCRSRRDRKDVFVVRDIQTGAQLQIGRNCLRDFLGMDDPNAIAHRFAFFRGVAELEEGLRARRDTDWAQSLEGALALAAVSIRLFGWCSKGQAQNNEDLTPTVYYVSKVLMPSPRMDQADRELIERIEAERSEADYQTARETIQWVREELKGDSDYEHNLKVLFSDELIHDAGRLGLIVSAVAGYHRAKEKALRLTRERQQAAKSAHVGTVGERLRNVPVTLQQQFQIGANEFGVSILIKFADDAGNLLTWITSKGSGLEVGEKAMLTGTVKAHDFYNDAAETKLTRCSITRV